MFFLCVQMLGLIGWIISVISYWNKDIKGILYFQVISGFFDMLHYYFLGAVTGFFVVGFETIRDFLYYKTHWSKYIFITTIPFYVVLGVVLYDNVISLYPLIASCIEGLGLSFRKSTAVVGGVVSAGLWMVYDFIAGSYVGLLTSLILLISNIVILFKDYWGSVKI